MGIGLAFGSLVLGLLGLGAFVYLSSATTKKEQKKTLKVAFPLRKVQRRIECQTWLKVLG